MEKKTVLFSLFISFISVVSAQKWVSQKLNKESQIDFPSAPDLTDTLGQQTYLFASEEALYMVAIRYFNEQSVYKMAPNGIEKSYDEVITGILDASGGKLIRKKYFEISGLKGVEIVFIAYLNDELSKERCQRIVYCNDKLYVVECWTYAGFEEKTKNNNAKFMNSFTFIVDESMLKQELSDAQMNAYQNGSAFGKIVIYLAIGIIIGLFFLLRFLILKSKNKTNNKN